VFCLNTDLDKALLSDHRSEPFREAALPRSQAKLGDVIDEGIPMAIWAAENKERRRKQRGILR
jgi:hypothetical protein